jgi:hypothetical protein
MVYTLSTTQVTTYTDNTIFTKLEINLMLFFMRLDRVEVIILISVKTLQT